MQIRVKPNIHTLEISFKIILCHHKAQFRGQMSFKFLQFTC